MLGQFDNLRAAVSVVHGSRYVGRRLVGNGLQRIVRKVRIAFCRAGLLVPQDLADDPLKAVANKTAAHIAAAMKNGNGGAEVVKLPKRKV